MRKGMTATQTIVALAVGLIVLVGLGYLVWTWIGKGGGEVSETYCRARLTAYCTQWSVYEFDPNEKPSGGFEVTGGFAPDCAKYRLDSSALYCAELLDLPGT
ncbi:MAG: hypothetical protein GF368_04060 [Candidatus Aenigmarchaeota archaeon]|nr:hypothetical protein [Candidatus Aenigmarchaeota archaeon]